MSILCDECYYKVVCAYTKDFEHIIDSINNVGFMTSTKVSDTKHLNDFELFPYTPHCKYFCKSQPVSRSQSF